MDRLEIIIQSGKHGKRVILIDEADYNLISKHTWRINNNRGSNFYAITNINRKPVKMHRMILGYPGSGIDHINGDGLDNRRSNLRLCNQSQNLGNCKVHKDNKSGYKGVFWSKERSRFRVKITILGKVIYCGQYIEIKDAARAYNNAALKYYGEFARLNEIH